MLNAVFEDFQLRPAQEADLQAVVDIYNSTVASRQVTADTEEVPAASRRDWFLRHTSERPLLVAERAGHILGWISFEPYHSRPAYRHTAELSIYLAPEQRGKGMGARLLSHAITLAPQLGVTALVGVIFSHNAPSLALFRKHGFQCWGELPNVAEMDNALYSVTLMGLSLPQ
ncbi:GNAT family N-acetyltransferase [Hahella sp. KA22]|uniref:GNAT family N-acetyltransferase n=1 Tax=Hahella sp. KA22 TaxID=1628392 RepID=UPI000FDD479E|nr:GNAT family N-acetyltransferase [Hahella sp. KA22]AZZ95240.1 N-acetyltransferase family protein [Hahella sp. KA22]QAY52885.1 GNAT family N-acetyltransferase [Hahella sp. KA22]